MQEPFWRHGHNEDADAPRSAVNVVTSLNPANLARAAANGTLCLLRAAGVHVLPAAGRADAADVALASFAYELLSALTLLSSPSSSSSSSGPPASGTETAASPPPAGPSGPVAHSEDLSAAYPGAPPGAEDGASAAAALQRRRALGFLRAAGLGALAGCSPRRLVLACVTQDAGASPRARLPRHLLVQPQPLRQARILRWWGDDRRAASFPVLLAICTANGATSPQAMMPCCSTLFAGFAKLLAYAGGAVCLTVAVAPFTQGGMSAVGLAVAPPAVLVARNPLARAAGAALRWRPDRAAAVAPHERRLMRRVLRRAQREWAAERPGRALPAALLQPVGRRGGSPGDAAFEDGEGDVEGEAEAEEGNLEVMVPGVVEGAWVNPAFAELWAPTGSHGAAPDE